MMHGEIASPADWTAAELLEQGDWVRNLGAGEIAELDAALCNVNQRGIGLAQMQAGDFPLPVCGNLLAEALDSLEHSRGIFLIRGFPAERYSAKDLRAIYWGLSKHLGVAVPQSAKGDLIGDVRDLNNDLQGVRGRGYTSNQDLDFHTDSCDVAGLFVLRTARAGGESLISSSVAVHNEIARTRPDLLQVLYETYPHSPPQPEFEDEPPVYHQPIFTLQDGHFACKFNDYSIKLAQRFPEVPRLSAPQLEALALFKRLAASPRFCLRTRLRAGDIQLFNNYVSLHARTEFEDFDEPDRRRHLLRLWLSVPNSRPLSPHLAKFFRDRRAGALRGGYPAKTAQRLY